MTHITYTETAPRRNASTHLVADQTLKVEGAAERASFPGAVLIERLTHRPPATCAELARLAGFREMEVA